MSLQAEVERVLALSELVDRTLATRWHYEEAALSLIRTHGPEIAAQAERLAVAEERVRVLESAAEPFARHNGSENPMRPEINRLRSVLYLPTAIDTARAGEGK